ncbi:MAG: PAS domain S-box protein [Candidatus Heimdallarchaeota archaeon]
MSRILLVDDDEHLLTVATKFLLREEPISEVATVTSAKAALQVLTSEKFDAIIADYQMPKIDGLELLKRIRNDGNSIPFIMFTGRGREEVAIQALNLGADHYLKKEGEPKSLYAELAHIINRILVYRRTEKALLKSEREKTLILNTTSDAINYYNRELKILWSNRAAAQTVGRLPEEMVGCYCYEIWRQRNKPCTGCPVIKTIETGEIHKRETITVEGKTWNQQAYPVRNATGEVIGAVEVALDISDLKQTERALRESEERFRRLAENAPDWIFRVQIAPEYRVEYVSPAVEKITGYTPEEYYADPQLSLKTIHPDDRPLLKALRDNPALDAKPAPLRWIHKDGTVRWTEGRTTPIYDDAGNLIAAEGIARDITDRKQAEESLRESEEKYRRLVDQSFQGLVIILDGRIVFSNPAFEKISGFSTEELLAFSPEEIQGLVHPEDQEEVWGRYQERLAGKAVPYHTELRLIRKDGAVRWISTFTERTDYLGKVGIQSTFIDITERKQGEEAYRTLVDQSLQGLAITQDGQIVFANPAASKITGYSIEELLALTPEGVRQVIHPEDRDFVMKYMLDRLAGKPAPEHYEFRAIRKDGRIRWVEVYASVIDFQGKPAIQRLIVDITKRKHAEEELQKFQAISDHAGYGVGMISPEGRLIYANPAFAQMHGYTPEELNGKDFSILHTEEQMTRVGKLKNQLLQEGYYNAEEVWHKRKDGTVFPTLMNGTAIQDATGKPLYLTATALEISDWKKAEIELQASEELYRTTIDSLSEIIHVVDADLRFILTNHSFKQYCKDFDLKTDVLGLTILEGIPTLPKTIIDEYQQILVTRKSKITEEKMVLNDKEFITNVHKIPILREGQVAQIITIIQDITEITQAQDRLKKLQNK